MNIIPRCTDSDNFPSVCHLTSVHPRYDTRIFHKMCCSLAMAGYKVTLVVADGNGDEISNGITILDSGKPRSRLHRMLFKSWQVAAQGLRQGAEVFHFHDPELIPAAIWIRIVGKKVIYDVHENVPESIWDKDYLPKPFAISLSYVMDAFERAASLVMSAVVAATPQIHKRFMRRKNTRTINNYPVLHEFERIELSSACRSTREICYLGVITRARGLLELVRALPFCDAKLNLIGSFKDKGFRDLLMRENGWRSVIEHGQLDRDQCAQILSRSAVGIVTFLPKRNHIEARPNKMFEYMAASLPVIASNFPGWSEIIEGNHCGVCVDPADPQQIAAAISKLLSDPKLARTMGRNGFQAVRDKYNWGTEERQLLSLYKEVL